MKRNALIIPILLLYLFGIAFSLTACGKNCFVGNRVAEEGFYRLDVDYMTGTDRLTMEIQANNTLSVQFETVKGFIYMEIKDPDENTLYAGNGKGVTEFSVNISESGTYSIYVEAHHAKGTVHIQQMVGKKVHRG